MQIRWLRDKLEWSAGGLLNSRDGHPQTPDPARASIKLPNIEVVSKANCRKPPKLGIPNELFG
eukprot:1158564-Pelagomonas_calceolata.AAC.5